MKSQVLLISNSGRPYLEHCRDAIGKFVGTHRRGAFVTAASYDDEATYHANARAALQPLGVEVLHLHTEERPLDVLDRVEALFVGGGNTFHLLGRLHAAHLLEAIRVRVRNGMLYIGS